MIYLYIILVVCPYAKTILSGIRIDPRTLKVPLVLNAKWNLSIVHVCFHLFDLLILQFEYAKVQNKRN